MTQQVVQVGTHFGAWVSSVRHLYRELALINEVMPAVPSMSDGLTGTGQDGPVRRAAVDEYMVSYFEVARDALYRVLPPDAVPTSANMVGLTQYAVRGAPGQQPRHGASLFVEVEAESDAPGNSARYVLWGLNGDHEFVGTFGDFLGYPCHVGQTSFEQTSGQFLSTSSCQGEDMLAATLSPKGSGPMMLTGFLHFAQLETARNAAIPSHAGATLTIQSVRWTAQVHVADLMSLHIGFPAGNRLARLRPNRLHQSYFGRQLRFEPQDLPLR